MLYNIYFYLLFYFEKTIYYITIQFNISSLASVANSFEPELIPRTISHLISYMYILMGLLINNLSFLSETPLSSLFTQFVYKMLMFNFLDLSNVQSLSAIHIGHFITYLLHLCFCYWFSFCVHLSSANHMYIITALSFKPQNIVKKKNYLILIIYTHT